MNDQKIEQEIQNNGLTAPRVTPSDIEAKITKKIAYDGSACGVKRYGIAESGPMRAFELRMYERDMMKRVIKTNTSTNADIDIG